jgi:hypothetical protein
MKMILRTKGRFSELGLGLLVGLGLLSAAVSAQRGSYTSFGAGCGKTINIFGAQANMACRVGQDRGTTGGIFAIVASNLTAKTIHGLSLLTYAPRPGVNGIELWLVDAQGKPNRKVAVGTIYLDKKFQQYRGKFTKPYRMPARVRHAFVLKLGLGVRLPLCRNGQKVQGWSFSPFKGWLPLNDFWSFREDCGSKIVTPRLTSVTPPLIGRTMRLDLSNLTINAPAWIQFGISNRAWGPLRLPLSLRAFGAPSCALLVSQELSLATPVTTRGDGNLSLRLPNTPALVGVRFFNQAMTYDKAANSLGFTFSNGGVGLIGKPCISGPSRTTGSSIHFALPRVNFFGFPGLSISGSYRGKQLLRCCSENGPQACRFDGAGFISGNVGQFSIPITTVGKVLDDVNAKICSTLDAVSVGSISCSTLLGISVGGIALNGSLKVLRDDCLRIARYTSLGKVTFPGGIFGGADVSATMKVPFVGNRKFTFKLGLTGTPDASWRIVNNRAQLQGRITSVRLTGNVTLPFFNQVVKLNLLVPTPALTFTTPWIPLPSIPIRCR